MYFWTILSYIDTILFILVALTVAYMGVFALLSMMSKNTEPPKSRKENRFIILIPAYKNGAGYSKRVHEQNLSRWLSTTCHSLSSTTLLSFSILEASLNLSS